MKLKNIVIVVKNLEKSKHFYKDMFGLDVILDREGNVILTEGLVLQEAKIWEDSIEKEVVTHHNAAELYFEERDMDSFVKKLESYGEQIQYLNLLHPQKHKF